jgi:hypothetical protein
MENHWRGRRELLWSDGDLPAVVRCTWKREEGRWRAGTGKEALL